jgi:hypothetical protein
MSDDTGTPAADAGTGTEPGSITPTAAQTQQTTFTQKDVNTLLASEKRKLQEKYAGFDDIKAKASKLDELEQASKTELERLTDTATQAATRAQQAELTALKYEVAAEKGIDLKHAHRLVGSNRKELEADAATLAGDFPAGVPGIPPGANRQPAGGDDMNSIIRRAAGRPG